MVNMVDHLSDQVDFLIVSSDRDSFETAPFPNIVVNDWNRVGKASVFYASPEFINLKNVRRLLSENRHDILYLNSFFNSKFTVLPLLVRRLMSDVTTSIVVATRGEFSPEALKIRRWKKIPYLRLGRIIGLYKNVTWQASSLYESADIKRVLKDAGHAIVVAPNLPGAVEETASGGERECEREHHALRVVFLARVSPMKNLDFAFRVLREVRTPLIFDVYGLIDDEAYWETCKLRAMNLPDNIKFKYHGVVEHSCVRSVLEKYDLFFLPTRGENYGHVIHETLTAGTPALISDRTPWRDLDKAGVGWVRPLDNLKSFVMVIEEMASQGSHARLIQRKRARVYAKNVAGNTDAVEKNLSLFLGAVNVQSNK
jgi:glycosyltransferase involved in cell wall biosynthesis